MDWRCDAVRPDQLGGVALETRGAFFFPEVAGANNKDIPAWLLRNQRERLFMGPTPFLLTLRIRTLLFEVCMYSGPFMPELRVWSDARLGVLRWSGTGELGCDIFWGGDVCWSMAWGSTPWSLGRLMMRPGTTIGRWSGREAKSWWVRAGRRVESAAADFGGGACQTALDRVDRLSVRSSGSCRQEDWGAMEEASEDNDDTGGPR